MEILDKKFTNIAARRNFHKATVTIPSRTQTRYYTITEAAKRYNISTATLYAAIRTGELKAVVKRGNSRGYRVTDAIMTEYINAAYTAIN